MITAEYKYTEEVAVDSVIEVTRAVSFASRLLPAVGCFAIVSAIWQIRRSLNFQEGLGPLVFGILMLSMPLITRVTAKRRFKQSPSAGLMMKWTFEKDKITNEMVGAKAEFEWKKLILIREMKKGFLLFPQKRIAHWVPKAGFRTEEEISQLRNLIKNQGIPYKS